MVERIELGPQDFLLIQMNNPRPGEIQALRGHLDHIQEKCPGFLIWKDNLKLTVISLKDQEQPECIQEEVS